MRTGVLLALAAATLLAACLRYEEAGVPAGRDAVRVVPLGDAEALTAAVAAVLPQGFGPEGFGPEDTALFAAMGEEAAVWAEGSLAGALDFSGVALAPGPAATLVTDRHVVYSAHVPLAAGSVVGFVARDGERVLRRLAEAVEVPVLEPDGVPIDLAVARLDLPVPAGVATYPLPSLPAGAERGLAGRGVPVIVTYAPRRATLGTLAAYRGGGARVVLALGNRQLGLAEAAGHRAEWGDSGHPSFYVADGALVLASHYHTNQGAGAGPNYADPRVRLAVTAAVAALGR